MKKEKDYILEQKKPWEEADSFVLCHLPTQSLSPDQPQVACLIFSAQLCIIKPKTLINSSAGDTRSPTQTKPTYFCHPESLFQPLIWYAPFCTSQLATGHKLICHSVFLVIVNWYLEKGLQFNLAYIYISSSLSPSL